MAIEIRVELSHIEPLVWRKVSVPNDITLDRLHLVIQAAMGWENSHLYMFLIDDKRYEAVFDDDDFSMDDDGEDESEFRLFDLVKVGDQLQYIYDFGDDWHHAIIVSAVNDERINAAKCDGGERACPTEDCGGPFGYLEFLAAIGDKKHPDHEHYSQWAGDFDPEVFNIEEANSIISNL